MKHYRAVGVSQYYVHTTPLGFGSSSGNFLVDKRRAVAEREIRGPKSLDLLNVSCLNMLSEGHVEIHDHFTLKNAIN